MSRLDKEREKTLTPKRLHYALLEIGKSKNVSDIVVGEKLIEFMFKGEIVRFYPYSGWATGKSIKDGRGIDNLINQLA
jgi:hypothetical protein